MGHTNIKNKLSEYRDGELSVQDRQAVEAHLPTCAECRTFLKNWDTLSDRLFPAATSKPASDLTAAVLGRIGAREESKPRLVQARWWAPAVGIAAVLVLSIMPLQVLNHPAPNLIPAEDVYGFILTDNGSDTAAMDLIFAAG